MNTNRLAPAVTGLLTLFAPLLAMAQESTTAPAPPWYWQGASGWGWIFPLFILLMMVACFAMMLGHRAGCGHRHGRRRPPTALELLDQRLARGEIGQAEYEEKRAAIRSRAEPPGPA